MRLSTRVGGEASLLVESIELNHRVNLPNIIGHFFSMNRLMGRATMQIAAVMRSEPINEISVE